MVAVAVVDDALVVVEGPADVVVTGRVVGVVEELVVVKNPGPMDPPIVVTLAKAPRKKVPLPVEQQSLPEPVQQ